MVDALIRPCPERYRGKVFLSVLARLRPRLRLFEHPLPVEVFRQLLRLTSKQFACDVPVYCFMPDHLHFLLRGVSPVADTLAAMTAFRQRSEAWLARRGRGAGWEGDFHDRVIDPSEDVRAHIRHIAENPVRAGIVGHWRQYGHTGAFGWDLDALLR